jgi:energy-coupling factor transporter transmembrane protein EcfT
MNTDLSSGAAVERSIHPLCALWGALAFLASLLMVVSPVRLIVLFLIIFLVIFTSRGDIAAILGPVWRAWPLIVIAFVIHAVVSSRITVDYHVSYTISTGWCQGLAVAALFAARLTLMLCTVSFLFWLHPAQRYGQALGRRLSRLPFGRARLAQVELTGTLALRFVPLVGLEAARLKMAWAARGASPLRSSWSRVCALRKLLFPLMVSALRRADHVADALAARGFDPSVARTRLRADRAGAMQLAATGLFTLVCLAVVWI